MDTEAFLAALYEDLEPQVVCVRLAEDSMVVVELHCDDWSGLSRRRKFDVECRHVKASEVSVGEVGSVDFTNRHPLLLEHCGAQGALYFSSVPADPNAVFFSAVDVLARRFEGWRDPLEFLNGEPREFLRFLEGGYGLLARGPLEVMHDLAERLSPLVSAKVLRTHVEQDHWKVFVVGDSWVVCDSLAVVERDG